MKNRKDVNIDRVKELHDVADYIIRLLDKGACEYRKLTRDSAKKRNRRTIHILNQALEYTELQMQKEWGFEQDVNKHTWWLKSKSCTCPKLDNTNPVYFGAGKIISADCPVHGTTVAAAWSKSVEVRDPLSDLQKLELELLYTDFYKFTVTGYFSNHRLSEEEIPAGMYRYSIRHTDDDDSRPSTLELNVGVNHYGDFLTYEEIKFPDEDGFCIIDDYSFIC